MRSPWTLQVWDGLQTLQFVLVFFTEAPPECVEHAHLNMCTANVVTVCCIGLHKLAMYVNIQLKCKCKIIKI